MRSHRALGPTLADVARQAGVSMPTVSRVLSGAAPVSPARREAVEQAIAELGYRPNPAARALARGQQTMVGVITHNTVRFGYATTMQGVQDGARDAGFSVAIAVVESATDSDVDRAIDLVLSQPIAGVIVMLFDPIGQRVLERLPAHIPVVVAGGLPRGGGVPGVIIDDDDAGYRATRFLLDQGHATVHHAAIPVDQRERGRHAGWRRALQDAGALIPHMIECDYDPASGYEGAGQLVDRYRAGELSAVLCGNDDIALGVYAKFADEGINIPDDVSVVGFDDERFASMLRPALTTVRQDFRAVGQKAFTMLHSRLGGHAADVVVELRAELVERDSHQQVPKR
ncbi:LacI family DNA-binding transcriptional regulator [Jonesia quinghaiensis]|uniref:LacI family DNA-binding transcriptional regulator n=1 Tax=Jonesia quinghaiensis TaxID=262806 RepID=UPI00041A5C4B|nr:LacI family DNA-binding transcriptional regulator [Jonesia quinghaiensis]